MVREPGLDLERATASLALLVLLAVVFSVPVRASTSLVQEVSGGFPCCPTHAGPYGTPPSGTPLPLDVTSGDVMILAMEGVGNIVGPSYPVQLLTFHDQRDPGLFQPASIVVQMVGTTVGGQKFPIVIYVSTITSSGPDALIWSGSTSLTLTGTGYAPFNFYLFEVSSVTTVGATTGSGSNTGTHVATSQTAFQTGAFLFSLIGISCGGLPCGGATPGTGFMTVAESSGSGASQAQYSDPVTSPTTFPATLSASSNWVEVGVTLPSTAPQPIPEYPVGIAVLAASLILYAIVKRRVLTQTTG